MKFFKNILSGGAFSTLISVVIVGLIIYGLTDLGIWGCCFFGYVTVEALSAANRVEAAEMDIRSLNRRLEESQQDIVHLWNKISDLKDELDEVELSRHE